MSIIKYKLTFCLLILCCIIFQSNTLQCKVCEGSRSSCLFVQNTTKRECDNEDDLCYSWFYRSGSKLGVIRDCISMNSPEYSLITELLSSSDSNCRKRLLGLDCFHLCSTDLCN